MSGPHVGSDDWMGAVVETMSYPSQQIAGPGSPHKTIVPAPPTEQPPEPMGAPPSYQSQVAQAEAPRTSTAKTSHQKASAASVTNGSIQSPA